MYFLSAPSQDDPANRCLLSTPSQQTPNEPSLSTDRNIVSAHPIPASSAPLNDRSVLPNGFSTTPAVPHAAGTPVATSDSPEGTGGVLEANAVHAAAASMPAARVSNSGSHTQLNVPAGMQTLTQQDVAAVHAWLSERLRFAKCGLCVAHPQVIPWPYTVFLAPWPYVVCHALCF